MHHLIVLHHCRNTEVSENKLCMLAVTEEEIAGLYVLMYNPKVMAVFEGSGSLQGYTAELVHVAIDLIFVESATLKVFHKFVVAIHSIHIHLSEVVGPDYHLEVDSRDEFHQLLLYLKLWIIYFEYELFLIFLDKEYLPLTGIVAEGIHFGVLLTTNKECFGWRYSTVTRFYR